MTREELKTLSDTTFYDNNIGGIAPDAHRVFNNELIAFIPDPPVLTAGGDLTGNYPNPTIRNGAVSFDKLSNDIKNHLITTYVVQLNVPLSSYISGLATIIQNEGAGDSYGWILSILNQGYSNIIIVGTDKATMSSLRITVNTTNTYVGILFFTDSSAGSGSLPANLILSRLVFPMDDRGTVEESKLTLGQI